MKGSGMYSVVATLIPLILLCETITTQEEKKPDENDINTPIITTGYDNISFVVNAYSFSANYNEVIDFKANTVLIDLYIEDHESGTGSIYLINGSDEQLVDYFTSDRKIEGYIYIISPQSIKISLNKFSGKITFRMSKNS